MKYYWEGKSNDHCYDVRGDKFFDTQEECYKDMCAVATDHIRWNTEWSDFFDMPIEEKNGIVSMKNADCIGYQLQFLPNKIVHDSYSGVYTWEIHTFDEETDKNKKVLRNLFKWENWDDGDFVGWQTNMVLNNLINFYNTKCLAGDNFANLRRIRNMRMFSNFCFDLIVSNSTTKNLADIIIGAEKSAIRQSVMDFSEEEVADGMMGEFVISHNYARIDTARGGDKWHCISMSNEDVANWIMTHFGGNENDIVEFIYKTNDQLAIDALLDEVELFFIGNPSYKQPWLEGWRRF